MISPSQSVFVPVNFPSLLMMVFTAPIFNVSSSISSRYRITSTLKGMVTLAPRTFSAFMPRVASSKSKTQQALYVSGTPISLKAVLCIKGDKLCLTGLPSKIKLCGVSLCNLSAGCTFFSPSVFLIEIISRTVSCPGADCSCVSSATKFKKFPIAGAAILLRRPASPMHKAMISWPR
ncbi:MAG: hypothetical protein BWY90_00498 [Deltaproteobacteria bacterium ADurb.BinA014]|nr:MAG: hypothetical protein BWY90_00498 [Deltaproteobacteria bacterium ADurb.BinA014]